MKLGNTLLQDLYGDQTYDYILSNPPFGSDWSVDRRAVEEQAKMPGTRFSHGLPPVSDGQMLFLAHCASKLRPASAGGAGGRAAVVSNGSPLFTGGPGSGPDQIRAWLLTSDLVDAIIALPTSIFYGTGIATYVWILDTNKEEHRKGRIQLIDGTAAWHPMGKGMGDKRREMTEADRDVILDAYRRFEDSDISKIVTADDLGYRDVPVHRIRHLTINITDDTVTQALTHKDATPDHAPLIRGLDGAWNDLPITIRTAAKRHGAKVSTGLVNAIMDRQPRRRPPLCRRRHGHRRVRSRFRPERGLRLPGPRLPRRGGRDPRIGVPSPQRLVRRRRPQHGNPRRRR